MAEVGERVPTVCSMTINSDDEVRVFKKNLEPQGFRFIELAPKNLDDAYVPGGHWIKKSCNPQVRCDILLISGHYMGTFFGSKGLIASFSDLQQASCDSDCSGIFEAPKEVFLFGCNTMADKERDSRSPEEYLKVLLEDGISVPRSEMGVAIRYTPIGLDFGSGTRKLFPNTQFIYGFNAIAPSGKNITPMLNQYFKNIGSYRDHLDSISRSSLKFNTKLLDSLRGTSLRRGIGIQDQNRAEFCEANSDQVSIERKIEILKNKYQSDGLKAFGVLKTFMEHHPDNKAFAGEARNEFDSISEDASKSRDFLSAIRFQDLIPTVVAEVLEVADYMKLTSSSEIRRMKLDLLRSQFDQMNLDIQRDKLRNRESKNSEKFVGLELERIKSFRSSWKDFDQVIALINIDLYPANWLNDEMFLYFLGGLNAAPIDVLRSLADSLFSSKTDQELGRFLRTTVGSAIANIIWKNSDRVDSIFGRGYVLQNLNRGIVTIPDQDLFNSFNHSINSFYASIIFQNQSLMHRRWKHALTQNELHFEYWPNLNEVDIREMQKILENPEIDSKFHFGLSLVLVIYYSNLSDIRKADVYLNEIRKKIDLDLKKSDYLQNAISFLRYQKDVIETINRFPRVKLSLTEMIIETAIVHLDSLPFAAQMNMAVLLRSSSWDFQVEIQTHIDRLFQAKKISSFIYTSFVAALYTGQPHYKDYLMNVAKNKDDLNAAYAASVALAKQHPGESKFTSMMQSLEAQSEVMR